MKRGTPLRRDTEKARQFQQRGRSSLKRKAVRTHPTARTRIFARSLGMCVVCLYDAGVNPSRLDERELRDLWERGVIRSARTPHHVFPQRMWPLLAGNSDGQVNICDRCHDQHEHAMRRIPRGALPPETLELAARFPELQRYLDKTYPA